MFGFGNKDKKKTASPTAAAPSSGGKKSREELIAEAQANMRAAREEIGQETIDKLAEALGKQQDSIQEKIRREVEQYDEDKVIDHLRMMIDEDKYQ